MVAELVSVAPDASGQRLGYIPLAQIKNDRPQVRRDWRHDEGQARLDELTESIRQHGVLQPIEVEQDEDGCYVVLVGHRRFVAAQRAGLAHIPATVRAATLDERTVLQLIENVHRQNLSPLDEARAYEELLRQHGGSAESLAPLVGVTANHIRNCVRLAADAVLREAVAHGRILKGAAHALSYLSPEYAQPLYDRLQAGGSVTMQDVQDAREQRKRDDAPTPREVEWQAQGDEVLRLRETGLSVGAIAKQLGVPKETVVGRFRRARQEHPDWQDPLEGNAGQVKARQNIMEAHRLRREGHSVGAIAAALGRSVSATKLYLAAQPVEVPEPPRVTVNGVSLDPVIAKAQERTEHKAQPQAARVPEQAPQPRPKASPLPWENQDNDGTEPAPWPALPAVDGSTVDHETASAPQAAQTARTTQVAAPADDPLSRLRFLLVGAEQPCVDLLQAVVRIGREQGWSCVELWRNVQAASDLFAL